MQTDDLSTNPARPYSAFVCLIVADAAQHPPLRRSLAGGDFELLFASSRAEALQLLRDDEVDVIIAEECLPAQAGSLLLEAVFHSFPHVARVLIGTDLGADVITQAVNRARVQRVLRNTMAPHSLREEVEGALNETLLARSLSAPAPARHTPPWAATTEAPPSG